MFLQQREQMRSFETAGLHTRLRMRIAVSESVPPQDSLYDFQPESMTVYREPEAPSSPWPVRTLATHENDSTSRVISFVLGFALASVIAWLGNIRADRPAATPGTDVVATAVIPVVTGTTVETKETNGEDRAALASLDVAAARPVAVPAPIAVRTHARPTHPAQPTASATAMGYRGVLVLNSSPQGAEVVVNGQVVGQTPVVLNDVPVGSRALLVRRDGYSPWSTSVRIVADRETAVQARLTPLP